MPDTPENQATYPQHSNQQEGCGFPLAKVVVLFSLLTGAVTEAISDVWSTYEPALLRRLKGILQHLNTFLPLLAMAGASKRKKYYDTLLRLVARETLPDRPNRREPRVVKRRPKSSRWMQKPRVILKQKRAA